MIGYSRRTGLRLALVSVSSLSVVACDSGPQIPGRWEATTSRDAGLEIKADGTFQGELPPNIRLQGKWVAKGSDVTFTLDGPTAQVLGTLTGKVTGDTMTLTASGPSGNSSGASRTFTFKRLQR
jgi:hypothetical protein